MDINEARSKPFMAMTGAFAALLVVVLLVSGGGGSRETASADGVQLPAAESAIVGDGPAVSTYE